MNWDLCDYVAASLFALFILVGIVVIRKLASNSKVRIIGILGVLFLAVLAWVQLAVGLI